MKEHAREGGELASETAGTHYGAQISPQRREQRGEGPALTDITRAHSLQSAAGDSSR